jgi:inorganic pyrophosphatase
MLSIYVFWLYADHMHPDKTWEDPGQTHPETKAKGDNDPLDVCEIGEQVGYTGQVKQVKVLGIMALLDEGETDWKVIVVDVNDPLASKLNDIEDVERHLPGLIRATNEWFRIYKIRKLNMELLGTGAILTCFLLDSGRKARKRIRLFGRG